MAKNLDLDVERLADGFRISWNDYRPSRLDALKNRKPLFYSLIALTIVAPPIGLVALVIAYYSVSRLFSNIVEITPSIIRHESLEFQTDLITRFEYGAKSQLAGVPPKTVNGMVQADLTLVRMWVEDNRAYTISENHWQHQDNHQIRDTLDRALTAVRKGQAEAAHVEKYGVQDDKGMPDY